MTSQSIEANIKKLENEIEQCKSVQKKLSSALRNWSKLNNQMIKDFEGTASNVLENLRKIPTKELEVRVKDLRKEIDHLEAFLKLEISKQKLERPNNTSQTSM